MMYANFSTAARTERQLPRTFVLAGLGAGLMPVLAGIVGILTLARYGAAKFPCLSFRLKLHSRQRETHC